MAKNLEPKCKQCRRAGEKLFLKGERCFTPKCEMVKRNYPPGVHGAKGKGRKSGYGMQLEEKQKAKKQYLLLEKQFRLTFEKAKKQAGNAGENLFKLLETRLDNVVYRLGFVSSRGQARELVNHGHFAVNNRKVNIPSCQVKVGDVVKVASGSRTKKQFSNLEEKLKKIKVPGWLNLDTKELSGKVLHYPGKEEIKNINFNLQMIVEFYSK